VISKATEGKTAREGCFRYVEQGSESCRPKLFEVANELEEQVGGCLFFWFVFSLDKQRK